MSARQTGAPVRACVVRDLLMRRAFIRKWQCKERKLKEDFRSPFFLWTGRETHVGGGGGGCCGCCGCGCTERGQERSLFLPSLLAFLSGDSDKSPLWGRATNPPSSLPPHAAAMSAFSI